MKIKMNLTRPAKKSGGDRYEGTLESGEELVIYFPQSISRPNGTPVDALNIEIKEN